MAASGAETTMPVLYSDKLKSKSFKSPSPQRQHASSSGFNSAARLPNSQSSPIQQHKRSRFGSEGTNQLFSMDPNPLQASQGIRRRDRQLASPSSHGTQTNLHGPSGPILRSREPWRSWTELTVRIRNLPRTVTTYDLWKRFESEGSVVFIEIFENRRGDRAGTAKIRFSPPPHGEFWGSGSVTITKLDGQDEFRIIVELEPKKRRFEVQSPTRKNIWYPETMNLYSSAVGFGFMHDKNTMMNMHSAPNIARKDIKFKIDLLRSRIIVIFPVELKDPVTKMQQKSRTIDRTPTYMFTIPFGQINQTIKWAFKDEEREALVIDLESPPMFFRKRLDTRATHKDGSLTWSEFDTWFRQTDIVYDPRRLENAPVALNKEPSVVDIGRWTTYYIQFEQSQNEFGLFDKILNALQDYNIAITPVADFKIVAGNPAPIWPLIDLAQPGNVEISGQQSQSLQTEVCLLPFEVRYQLEVCISQGVFNEHNITPRFVNHLAELAKKDPVKARHILEYAADRENIANREPGNIYRRIYDPMSLFNDDQAMEYSPQSKIPHYCAYSRKVQVTPTSLFFSSPTVETTNRVIREYADAYGDRFLRVQFTDEKFEGRINSCANKERNDEIFARIYRNLRNGIRIGDRHYEFLAFGNSQFRENGAYFFCPTEHKSCADIREWMGDFKNIRVTAKYAARLGLCFSTTRAIHSSGVKLIRIRDVEKNGYCFTDGVGMISEFLATMIATELNIASFNQAPSAFQFRLGGAKGVLAVWPKAKGREVYIRDSQTKFRAKYNGLEIVRWSQYAPATLNRQTITILSSLGVRDEVFNKMLTEQLLEYQAAMVDKSVALDLLGRYIDENHMTMTIGGMLTDDFMEVKEPFVLSLLRLWRAWSIKFLKEKARIMVENGAFLLGVTDETRTLRGHIKSAARPGSPVDINELPEIFLQVPDKNKKGSYVIIEGTCLLGRNPSLHPGDIRVVQAVDVPALHHLRDVVVFSQNGDRDVPSMCSGGDLDGDDFFIIWERDLIPPEWNAEPMNYTSPKAKELDRPVEIQDVIKFFVRFMKNDALPTIAHAHLAQCDYLELGAKDSKCLELAELHSKAVDYVKTGEPAEIERRLKPRMWPHFMEKKHKPKEQIYNSEKILGQLYDRVESVNFIPQYEASFDQRILKAYPPDNAMLRTARQIKSKYDTAVKRIMAQREIGTEFEVWTAFVLSKPRVGSDYKMQEDMGKVADALKDQYKKLCIEAAGGNDIENHLGPFVAAMYQVTWEETELALLECRTMKQVDGKEVPMRKMEPKSMPLISFPWLFHKELGRIANSDDGDRGLEELKFSFENKAKKVHKVKPDVNESDSEDFVETAGGIIHRGQLLPLDIPHHDHFADEAFEQPYTNDGSASFNGDVSPAGKDLGILDITAALSIQQVSWNSEMERENDELGSELFMS